MSDSGFAAMEGFPAELVEIDPSASAVRLRVDANLYPLDALYGASYIFIDRCYVLLDQPTPSSFRVTLTAKKPLSDLRALVGEFQNELLSCAWRAKIAQESRATIEAVTAQALSGARGAPSLDDLQKFDFADDTFDDPLGIAKSWEEKYKKKSEGSGGTE
jgi:His-Xaa-Ser system protein HxsD